MTKDRVTDHKWHDIRLEDLPNWVKHRIKKLDHGQLVGRTFRYRRNYYTGKVQRRLRYHVPTHAGFISGEEESFEHESIENDVYYDILGVKPNATKDEIIKAYRQKIKEYHPDKFMNQPEWVRKQAEEMSKKLNEAYEALS
jgi:hypothetical protein